MAGKKLKEALSKLDHEKLYQPQEALELLKQIAFAKFDETVEIHLRTGVDPRHADQVIRSSVALPAGTGKTRRVVAFAQGEKVREAEEGRLGRVLGPRGLMPNPRTGTVTDDIGRVIREVKGGRIDFRVDKTAVIHMPIGRVSFDVDKLMQNLAAAVDAVVRAKPTAAKGQYIRSITVATTMGPGIKLELQPTLALAAA